MMPNSDPNESRYAQGMEKLVGVVQKLSTARDIESIVEIARNAARELTGADGATFVLREGDLCYYVDENAIGPLWKGRRFPMSSCISGWAMMNRESAVIEDIYNDPRIPADAYRTTFVKSLIMVPVRKSDPIAAIGNYWAQSHHGTPEEVALLQALADSTSIALENVKLYRDLKLALEETLAARDALAKQLDLRDEFVSVSAHELKTPLTPILVQTQFLNRVIRSHPLHNHPLEQHLTKSISVVSRQLTELTKKIDDLLDVSRIRLGQFSFEFGDDVDLGKIIHSVVEAYEAMVPGQIKVETDDELVGHWDKTRLEQLIQNLVSNAVKYGCKKPIQISAHQKQNHVEIQVKDHGFGIAKEDQERIFNRFERATSMKSYGGLGLGLFIARKIAQGHGGTVQVESEPGHGSVFVVRLPKTLVA
jgi:signal transduction histidine kinase